MQLYEEIEVSLARSGSTLLSATPSDAENFLDNILDPIPSHRFVDAKQLMEHKFFKDVNWESLRKMLPENPKKE